MSIIEAAEAMNEGKRVRRSGEEWAIYSRARGCYYYDDDRGPWIAFTVDLLATDWEITQ